MQEFSYDWSLKDAVFTKDKGKVFSCFAGGGGSSLGYKLAGYDVIGCLEIDKKMIKHYKQNLNPKYAFQETIQEFKLREDLPEELYNLDILDASPPCSSFSVAGVTDRDWGKKRTFREGQFKQVLDTLFFDTIDLAKKLQPKVVVAENVKGLLHKKASKYVQRIYKEFKEAGYSIQHFLLNGSKMGLPQRRERVFFIALRNDLVHNFTKDRFFTLKTPKLELKFNYPEILFKEIADYKGREITEYQKIAWNVREVGDKGIADSKLRAGLKYSDFSRIYIYDDKVPNTLTATKSDLILFSKPVYLSVTEMQKISSFPKDYEFDSENQAGYIMGMSVPPLMMARISSEIYKQWFSKL